MGEHVDFRHIKGRDNFGPSILVVRVRVSGGCASTFLDMNGEAHIDQLFRGLRRLGNAVFPRDCLGGDTDNHVALPAFSDVSDCASRCQAQSGL